MSSYPGKYLQHAKAKFWNFPVTRSSRLFLSFIYVSLQNRNSLLSSQNIYHLFLLQIHANATAIMSDSCARIPPTSRYVCVSCKYIRLCLSVCLTVPLPVCRCLSVRLTFCLSDCLFVWTSICMFVCLSVCPSPPLPFSSKSAFLSHFVNSFFIYLPIHPSIYMHYIPPV